MQEGAFGKLNVQDSCGLDSSSTCCRAESLVVDRSTVFFQNDSHRAMVGPKDVGVDECAFEPWAQASAQEKIIDTPADVPRAGVGERRPPGVMPAAFLEFAKGVNKASLHKRSEASAFLRREAVISEVGFRVSKINFSVCHVQVTAENHRFTALELFEVTQEVAVPLLAVRQPAQVALRVGHIDVDEEKIGELGREHAAFTIMRAKDEPVRAVQ